jgi:CBS domain-containing protein
MKVHEIMHSDVKSCAPETTLAEAAALMWEVDCGALPVVSVEGKVLGMITDRDIAIATATRGRLASDICVAEVMGSQLYACELEEDVHSALKLMRHEKVRRLPVVTSGGLLQGILSLNDIVLRAEEAKGKHVPELTYEDAMSTIKAVCEHRPQALMIARA